MTTPKSDYGTRDTISDALRSGKNSPHPKNPIYAQKNVTDKDQDNLFRQVKADVYKDHQQVIRDDEIYKQILNSDLARHIKRSDEEAILPEESQSQEELHINCQVSFPAWGRSPLQSPPSSPSRLSPVSASALKASLFWAGLNPHSSSSGSYESNTSSGAGTPGSTSSEESSDSWKSLRSSQ